MVPQASRALARAPPQRDLEEEAGFTSCCKVSGIAYVLVLKMDLKRDSPFTFHPPPPPPLLLLGLGSRPVQCFRHKNTAPVGVRGRALLVPIRSNVPYPLIRGTFPKRRILTRILTCSALSTTAHYLLEKDQTFYPDIQGFCTLGAVYLNISSPPNVPHQAPPNIISGPFYLPFPLSSTR